MNAPISTVVTGGAGFIGSHVVDLLLARGDRVVVIDDLSTGRLENLKHCIGDVEFVQADISSVGTWTKSLAHAQWVIHLAALADIVPSIRNPGAYYKANVTGTVNVLEAARESEVRRVVYAASSSCYGIPDLYPTPEAAEIRPEYPYALTKRMGEELVLHWAKVYGLPSVSLRFFNVYGPRSRTSGTYGAVFGVFLAQKLAGVPLTIVGDGTQTRDFTYVTDVASAVVSAAESDVTGIPLNVGTGQPSSINQIAELIGGSFTHIPERPGEPPCTFADISRTCELLNWSPTITLEEGVRRVLNEIEYWRHAPVWTPDSIAGATADWFRYLGGRS